MVRILIPAECSAVPLTGKYQYTVYYNFTGTQEEFQEGIYGQVGGNWGLLVAAMNAAIIKQHVPGGARAYRERNFPVKFDCNRDAWYVSYPGHRRCLTGLH